MMKIVIQVILLVFHMLMMLTVLLVKETDPCMYIDQ
nr:MAG TPA: Toxin Ibs, type I toxin-antitoxin system [Caudoviricetes sp.]